MKEKKKRNLGFKYTIILLCCAIIGLGGSYMLYRHTNTLKSIEVSGMLTQIMHVIAENMMLEIIILFVVAFIWGECKMVTLEHLGAKIKNADELEFDRIDYAFKKEIAFERIIALILQMLGFLCLGTRTNIDTMREMSTPALAFVLMFIFFAYLGYLEIRTVKLEQKIYPEKKGDPTSIKYSEQYLESCDEAEKEIIYQSAYKSYQIMSKCLFILMFITTVMHMIWNIGFESVIIVCVLLIVQNTSYHINSIRNVNN